MNKNIERLIYWNIKTAKTEQGFITIEVIAALVVGFTFFMFSLQAFVYSIGLKVQAQEKQRANELIQEDIERMSQLGSNPALAGVCNPTGGTPYNNGYGSGLWNSLIAAVPNNDAALTKTIINKIQTDGLVDTGGQTLALRRFHVSTNAGASDAPHRTLKVGYQVWYGNSATNTFLTKDGVVPTATDNAIAETYVEVIPDVALLCP